MNTTESNKLIAEFMGLHTIVETNGVTFKDNNTGEIHLINYNTEWNWLMEVVEKIESLGYRIEIVKHICRIYLSNKETIIISENTPKIEAVYIACVEFIKWYNKQ